MKRKTSSRVIKTLILMFSLCLCSCGKKILTIDNTLEYYEYKVTDSYNEEEKKVSFNMPDYWESKYKIYRIRGDNPGNCYASRITSPINNDVLKIYTNKNGSINHAMLDPISVKSVSYKVDYGTNKRELSTNDSTILHYEKTQYVIDENNYIKPLIDIPLSLETLYISYDQNDERKKEFDNPEKHIFILNIFSYYPDRGAERYVKCDILQ